MINICKCGWKHSPGAHKFAFYPVSQCQKMSHYVGKPYYQSYYIADLISCFYFLSLFPIFILWRSYSISWYQQTLVSIPLYIETSRLPIRIEHEKPVGIADKLFRWRINFCGGGLNIPQADKILRGRVKFFPPAAGPSKKNQFLPKVPKMSHSAENVAQCQKTLP